MKLTTSPAQWTAALLLLVVAGTHVPLIGEHLEEAPYVGWLFIALSATCVALAVVVAVVDRPAVWVLIGLTCFAALVAFVASRTMGLPQIGDDVGNWTEPLGFPALASEALVVAHALLHLRSQPRVTNANASAA